MSKMLKIGRSHEILIVGRILDLDVLHKYEPGHLFMPQTNSQVRSAWNPEDLIGAVNDVLIIRGCLCLLRISTGIDIGHQLSMRTAIFEEFNTSPLTGPCLEAAISLITNIVEMACEHESDLDLIGLMNYLDLFRV